MSITRVRASNVATKGLVSKHRDSLPTVPPETEEKGGDSFLM